MTEEYDLYVHQMWIKNCVERDNWAQDIYSKQEYIERNAQFLKDNYYISEMGDKVWNGEEYVNPSI